MRLIFQAVKFWQKLGVSRVVLAREVSLDEIKRIKDEVPDMELEAFVHGAMCISYSGRCLFSNFTTGRGGNQGACAQPCRWEYEVVEKKGVSISLCLVTREARIFLIQKT